MKNTIKLLSLLLATLLLLACFASCGEKPAETTEAAEVTTEAITPNVKETTTAKPKPPTTSRAATTTKPVTTTVATTKIVTTREDPEPVIPAAEHTAHQWYSVPTFTPYAEKKADGTIGELATHCRYEGCTAVKEGVPQPTLIWMDFENSEGVSLKNYVEDPAIQNVTSFQKDTSYTNGTIKNGQLVPKWSKTQVMIEDTIGLFLNYTTYTVSFDLQVGTYNAFVGLTYFGPETVSYYTGQVRANETTGTIELCRGTKTDVSLDGNTLKLGGWYHFDMEFISNVKDPGVSTLNIYKSEWIIDDYGDRIKIDPEHDREFLGCVTGIPMSSPSDEKSQESYNKFIKDVEEGYYNKCGFRLGYKSSISALDNFAVTITTGAQ